MTDTSLEKLRKHITTTAKKLSQEEILWLFRKEHSRRTKKEVNSLIEANYPLVYRIANGLLNKHKTFGNNNLQLEELFQSGVVGLCEAIAKYDSYRKTKFSTYAYFLISCHIRKEINNNVYQMKRYNYSTYTSQSLDDADKIDIEDKDLNTVEYNDILDVAKKTLTDEEYKIFIMYFHEKYNMREISDILEFSTSKCLYVIKRIREKLKEVF